MKFLLNVLFGCDFKGDILRFFLEGVIKDVIVCVYGLPPVIS